MNKPLGAPAMTETNFTKQVIDLAHLYQWRVCHFRTSRIQRENGQVHYATPVQADGAGFPDLVLAKCGKPILFLELKSDKGVVSPEQEEWLRILNRGSSPALVFHPKDFDKIEALLKGGA